MFFFIGNDKTVRQRDLSESHGGGLVDTGGGLSPGPAISAPPLSSSSVSGRFGAPTSSAAATSGEEPADVSASISQASEAVGHPSTSSAPSVSSADQDHSIAMNNSVASEANLVPEGNWLSYLDLMNESYPAKSKVVYLKAFKLFEKFLKSKNQWQPDVVPSELQVLNYFYYLRHELRWAPTTLWSTYARVNAVMIRVYGVSLKSYARVANVLKSYDSGHTVKQASIFTPQQIEDFVSDPELSSKYWLVRKVVALIGYFGGFRNIELKSLKFENCELDSMGYWFSFQRSKQRGRLEHSSICVPRRQVDWIPVVSDSSRTALDFDPASLIDLYLAECQADFGCSRDELKGDFFRATHGEKGLKFTRLTLGKNTIGKVGVQAATELCLPNPENFTGHCWRRSCGTSASDSGVNVTTLMGMMGWSSPKTAMVYVKKSRTTSLQMSLYLANVQRRNCSKPFPKSPLEIRQVIRQSQGQASNLVPQIAAVKTSKKARGGSKTIESSKNVSSRLGSVLKEEEQTFSTQELIQDAEIEFKEDSSSQLSDQANTLEDVSHKSVLTVRESVGEKESRGENVNESVEGGSSGVISMGNGVNGLVAEYDSRASNILQNLSNAGNLTIHFHFDRK